MVCHVGLPTELTRRVDDTAGDDDSLDFVTKGVLDGGGAEIIELSGLILMSLFLIPSLRAQDRRSNAIAYDPLNRWIYWLNLAEFGCGKQTHLCNARYFSQLQSCRIRSKPHAIRSFHPRNALPGDVNNQLDLPSTTMSIDKVRPALLM